MDTATQILVIINSTVLVIFLIIGIILMVKSIKLVDELKIMVQRAERVADSVGNIADSVGKTVGPLSALKLISQIISQVNGSQNKRNRKDD